MGRTLVLGVVSFFHQVSTLAAIRGVWRTPGNNITPLEHGIVEAEVTTGGGPAAPSPALSGDETGAKS